MIPSAATLKRYGLTEREFFEMARNQNDLCPICGQLPSRWVVDHEHVPGWKLRSPQNRRKYVRGLVCWYCNWRFLAKGITVERACNLADYLLAYQRRKTPVTGPTRAGGG